MEGAASHAVAVTGLLLALVVEAHPQVTWQKHPTNPVISSSLAGTVLSPSVLFDSTTNQYRMWFTSASSGWRIFSASSEDGTTWTLYSGNPVLTAGERPWENDGVCHADVIYDGTRFRMYYTGLGPPTLAAIGLAFSNDGVNWTRYSGEPILERVSGTWESVHVSWPKVYFDGSGYRMLYLGYNGTFTETGLATSADGISWIKPGSSTGISGVVGSGVGRDERAGCSQWHILPVL
jgi:predicted GH43/DUF377 family glycosyl hydrolase